MNDDIKYIVYDEALIIYQKMLEKSGGGFSGIRDEKGIRSTLDFIQNDIYYPSFVEKLTYLVFCFCSGHYFNDGNKRIALTLGSYFLHKNGYCWTACIFMRQVEAIIYHVAASHIDKEMLQRIMQCIIAGTDYDEGLKIDIAKAMNKGTLGIQDDIEE
ncbi:Fic family protein [Parabacteroides sp. W1-Q-101]|nr:MULTISPECIES: Fic family protein [unclassified Parabacteroides]MCM0722213.1 Fic family protein [Parabacteroides sp. W1-Q-101]